MDEEKLIALVRQYEELYNVKNKKYTNAFHRDKVWSIIGQQLHVKGEVCKRRWISLRDQYRKVLKNRIKTGQTLEEMKKWKFEDNLAFIVPYFKIRKDRRCNLSAASDIWDDETDAQETKIETIYFDDDHDNISNDSVGEMDWSRVVLKPSVDSKRDEKLHTFEAKKIKLSQSDDDDISFNADDETIWSQAAHPPPSPKLLEQTRSSSKTQKRKQPQELLMNTLEMLQNGIRDLKPTDPSTTSSSSSSSSSVHPIDLFFNGLAATVKTFCPEFQHIAKSKIFSIVSDMEWEQIQKKKTDHVQSVVVVPLDSTIPQ